MAAREEGKAMAGLLRRSLARDAGTDSGEVCPQPEILAAYFDRALDAEETARYDLHFSRCAVCREQLAAMARAGGDAAAEKKSAGAWDWLVGPRWLMPAAAMVVALLVIGGTALRLRKPMAPANEIAMARPDVLPAPSSAPSPSSEPDANSATTPEVAPPSKSASPTTRENLVGRPAERVLPRMPHADGASRRDELSAVGAAGAKPAIAQPMAPQAQMNSRAMSPGAVRGAVRAGNASASAAAPASSADETVFATSVAPAPVAAPPADKKADARSVESDTDAALQAEEAKEANAAKTKLPPTAVPARSMTAMNLSASQTTQAAALAKLQQAQISSNLMNLQIQTPDPKILWMIVSAGAIEKSEDGGATWKPVFLERHAPIVAGSAPTVKICWLVGGNGIILRTTNGTHWKNITPPAETDFMSVEATDASTATVTSMDGRKFSTADGGKSWSSVK